jgi:hypothetical protein
MRRQNHQAQLGSWPATPPGATENEAAASLMALFDRLAVLEQKLDEALAIISGAAKSHYTVQEVARLTGRTPYTVRRWNTEGPITATRIEGTGPKGQLLIARTEIEKLLRHGRGGELPGAGIALMNDVLKVPGRR